MALCAPTIAGNVAAAIEGSEVDQVQSYSYRLKFKADYLEKKGAAFQDWFVQLAGLALGARFEPVRPYGKQGDLKCDGRDSSTGTTFQAYAPAEMKDTELIAKIRSDFSGALAHWGEDLKRWVFVHNDSRGLPPKAQQLLEQLRKENPNVEIEQWWEPQLCELAMNIPLGGLQTLWGYVPSMALIERTTFDDLVPVISALAQSQPSELDVPLTPPSAFKIQKNELSTDAANLLIVGRRKSDLVRQYFQQASDADLGERIAQAFRDRYQELRASGFAADKIFSELQRFASMDYTPSHQAAALAVITYFFESCDIYEDPDGVLIDDLA